MIRRLAYAIAALFVVSASIDCHGQDLRQQVTHLYEKQARVTSSFSQAALSPDGLRIAWSLDGANGGSQIYVAKLADSQRATRISSNSAAANCWDHDPVWSKDGKQLAFLSDCATTGQTQLFVEDIAVSPQGARQLTNLSGYI